MTDADIQKDLTDYVNRELVYWDFSGVIRIIKDGKIFWETCRGYANMEFGVENTMSTRFAVASVTKQFTAFAVMLLYDRGLLSLDADANRYLPSDMQIPSGITVHDLLCHTSGLYNYYNFHDDFYICGDRLPYNKKVFFDNWINKRPIKSAGTEYGYNNSNYNLLAWIIENIAKQPYAEFLSQNIFHPLNMTKTEFDNGTDILIDRASNYMHDYGRLVRTPYVNNLFSIGAGALVTDCGDLQKWYECLKQRKLLSGKAYDRYFTENMCHYCYGLERYNLDGVTKYAHGGDLNGVAAYVQYFFEQDICIIILSNTESLNQYRLGNTVADLMFGKKPQNTVQPDAFPVSEEELQKFTGTYLPGKIHIEVKDGKLYLVRVNHNIHIELYCIGPNTFLRRLEESDTPYVLWQEGADKPAVWGFELVCKEFI